MQIHNKINLTPHPVELAFCQDKDGRDIAVALLKATFRFSLDGCVLPASPETALPVFLADVLYGKPGQSSVRYASDGVPSKPATDVALSGHVYGHKRASVKAVLRVGALEKTLVVSGERGLLSTQNNVTIGPPEGFDALPLRYEHAYGGAYVDADNRRIVYLHNPVGQGFAEAPRADLRVPRIEYPAARMTSLRDRPPPAGLGFIPTGWLPRVRYAGSFDAAWRENRRPLFPADFDERFYHAVPADQVLSPRLVGGEPVELHNLHRAAACVRFTVPEVAFSVRFHIKDRCETVAMQADTLLIEPDEERFAITFRASYPVDDDLRLLRSVMFRDLLRDTRPEPTPRG